MAIQVPKRNGLLKVEYLEDRTLLSNYNFIPIADTRDGRFQEFGEFPSLNNVGTVEFRVDYESIFTGNGKSDLTTIIDKLPLDLALSALPSLGDQGTVVYMTVYTRLEDPPESLIAANGEGEQVLANVGTFCVDGDQNVPSISPGEKNVAFLKCDDRGIFRDAGNTLTPIADLSSGFFQAFSAAPAVNDGGTVAFFATLSQGGSGIFTGDGKDLRTISDTTSGRFRDFGFAPAINSTGTVAFQATLARGNRGIFFRNPEGAVTPVAITGTSFLDFGPAPSINDSGTVAFMASLPGGGSGIFVGPDVQNDAVITTGDDLLGSTVTGLGFFRQGLNDAGQVAFFAQLKDGGQVIVRADLGNRPSMGTMTDARALTGIFYSQAESISGSNRIRNPNLVVSTTELLGGTTSFSSVWLETLDLNGRSIPPYEINLLEGPPLSFRTKLGTASETRVPFLGELISNNLALDILV